jgi:hypothetical protein
MLAGRTIVALWKNRNLSPEQKLDIIASVEAGDMKYSVSERQKDINEPFLAIEEASMSEVVSRVITISVSISNPKAYYLIDILSGSLMISRNDCE